MLQKRTTKVLDVAPLSRVPTPNDLKLLVRTAHQHPRQPIQQSLNVEGRTFLLSVTGHSQAEIYWALWSKESSLFTYVSNDMELIENMIAAAIDQSVRSAPPPVPPAIAPASPPSPPVPAVVQTTRQSVITTSMPAVSAQHMQHLPSPPPIPSTLEPSPHMMAANSGVLLAGDIAKVELANVLQSVSICKMTGRLQVSRLTESVSLFFEEGNLIHATTQLMLGDATFGDQTALVGNPVILELLLWEEGEFRFTPDVRAIDRTVNKRMDFLLMEGATLSDQWRHLKSMGVTMESRLQKRGVALSESDFEAATAKGIPADMAVQKKLYLAINGESTVSDTIASLQLTKPQWVSALFNLVHLGIVSLPRKGEERLVPVLLNIDEIAGAWVSLLSPVSKVLSRPLFLYFYFQEFSRLKRANAGNFTVVVFDLSYKNGNNFEPLDQFNLPDVMNRISQHKGELDVIGHYYDDGYAILMPYSTGHGAQALAQRVWREFQRPAEQNSFDTRNLRIICGAATAPTDSTDPGMLLRLAVTAKESAAKNNKVIELAGDFNSSPSS